MPSTLLLLFLIHAVLPVSSDFLGSISSAANKVGTAIARETDKAEKVVSDTAEKAGAAIKEGAEEAGAAVTDGAEKAGKAVVDVSEKAGRAAGDAALQQSGKCELLSRDRHKIAPIMSPLIARGFQESAEDPSADVSACRKVAGATALALMHRHWHDVTGLSDKIAAGLLGGILDDRCNPTLMKSLKTHEATRKSDGQGYQKQIQETLRKSVFTDAWIEDFLESHCGISHVLPARLFAESNEGTGQWSQRTSLSPAAVLATLSLAILLVPIGRRMRQRSSSDVRTPLSASDDEERHALE